MQTLSLGPQTRSPAFFSSLISTLLFKQILFRQTLSPAVSHSPLCCALCSLHLKWPSLTNALSTCKCPSSWLPSHPYLKSQLRVTSQYFCFLGALFTFLPSITFFTNLLRAMEKRFGAQIRNYLHLPLPPQQSTKQLSILPGYFYWKATQFTTSSFLDRHWPALHLILLLLIC